MIKSRGLNPLHHVLATGHRNKETNWFENLKILTFFTSFLYYFVLEKYILLKKIFFTCSQKYLFVHCITIIVHCIRPILYTQFMMTGPCSLKSNHSKWYHIASSLFKSVPPFHSFLPPPLHTFPPLTPYLVLCLFSTLLQLKRTK